MKCIHNIKTFQVKRVSNERAKELIDNGKEMHEGNKLWEYCSKSQWKTEADTTWKRNSVPANPMSPNKVRRQEMRNR